MKPFISAIELNQILDDPNLVLLDCSWHLPNSDRIGKDEYMQSHIKGAYFFDIDAMSQPEAAFPHTMPSAEYFANQMRKQGFSDKNHYVLYDQSPVFF